MNKIFALLLLTLGLFTGCGTNDQQTENKVDNKDTNSIKKVVVKKTLAFDKHLTDISKFIAGMQADDFDSLQKKPFYERHKKFTDDSWKISLDSMLNPVKNWCSKNGIGDERDSVLCFYPLSGPDFLFGNLFFPNADNYVMLGLEPRGTMCDFSDMTENAVMTYLDGIQKSMKYINSRGYFVTSHMGSDFSRHHLNGMVHMMLYMMARTGHPIVDVYNVAIDSTGKESRIAAEEIKTSEKIIAIKIDFLSPDTLEKRSAYYFKLDASDKNLDTHPEFMKFIDAFGKRVAYMKSASCVLSNPGFNVMRNLVLNSDKILQDDTGVPYKHFVADSTLTVQLFGTYSKVINDLNWCLQPALRDDLKKSPGFGNLPFRISYNGNYGEGMLLWAVRK